MSKVYLLYVDTESGDNYYFVFATPPDKERIESFLKNQMPEEFYDGIKPYYQLTEENVIY